MTICVRFFLSLLVIQLVVALQDDSEPEDELIFAHIVNNNKIT